MTTSVERFFARYEEGANTFDPDLVVSQYAPTFMGADPNGTVAIPNDAAFRKAIPERKAFFQSIGFRSARVLGVEATPLDDRYTMAKVNWRLIFEKTPGKPQTFEFYLTYFLFDPGPGPTVVFYISHDDETAVMREAGLLDGL